MSRSDGSMGDLHYSTSNVLSRLSMGFGGVSWPRATIRCWQLRNWWRSIARNCAKAMSVIFNQSDHVIGHTATWYDMLRHSILLMSRHCSAQVFPSLSFQTSSVHGLLRNNLTVQSVTSSRHPRLEFLVMACGPKVRTACRYNLARRLPTSSR